MTDLDQQLQQMGELPPDPRLAHIDSAVFAGLAEAKRPLMPRAALEAIAGIAMCAGLVSGMTQPAPHARTDLFPLGSSGILATSSLLGEGP